MAVIYAIPGLGTDERVFSKLFPLLEAQGHRCICLPHLEPLHQKEAVSAYAQRLCERLPAPNGQPLFVLGLSLGGPIAVELAKQRSDIQLILLSTSKQNAETPSLFKLARRLPLYRFVPIWYTHYIVPLMMRWAGIGNREDSALLGAMFRAHSAAHFAWGRRAIVHWENQELPAKYWHINGDKDHIFNSALPHVTHRIAGGTHNMVLDRAEAVAAILLPLLEQATVEKA
jgi:pimeloyl-ACP methyl ester carboxylesterase